ncbi:hypothetical protein ACLMJK_009276 [Lecanora helva]
MSNPAVDVASTLQSASIKRHPSPHHDLNPSTAASQNRPVSPTTSIASSTNSIPSSALKPVPRRANLPPLPDLRFEQSYLASLQGAETWWRIAWITGRDQVLLPLVQGTLWTLALSGWRFWNRGAALRGQGLGVRVRKWWWRVNNWELPKGSEEGLAEHIGEYYTTQLGTGSGD